MLLLLPAILASETDPVPGTINTRNKRAALMGFLPGARLMPDPPGITLETGPGRRQFMGLYPFTEPEGLPEFSALSGSLSSGPVLSGSLSNLPMRNAFVVGSTNTVRLKGLRNDDEREYIDGTANVELVGVYDANGTAVPGTEGIAMPYITGTGRSALYRGVIPHTVPFVAGDTYTRTVVATDDDGNVRQWDDAITAEEG